MQSDSLVKLQTALFASQIGLYLTLGAFALFGYVALVAECQPSCAAPSLNAVSGKNFSPLPNESEVKAALTQVQNNLQSIRVTMIRAYNQRQDKRYRDCRRTLRTALSMCQSCIAVAPDNAEVLYRTGKVYDLIGDEEERIAKHKSAEEYYRKAIEKYDCVLANSSKHIEARSVKADCLRALAAVKSEMHQRADAITLYLKAVEEYDKAMEERPLESDIAFGRGKALLRVAYLERDAKIQNQALGHYSDAIASFKQALQLDPNIKYVDQYMSLALEHRGNLLEEQGQAGPALECMQQSYDLIEKAAARDQDDSWTQYIHIDVLDNLADLYSAQGRKDEALKCRNTALEQWKAYNRKWPKKLKLYWLRILLFKGDLFLDKH